MEHIVQFAVSIDDKTIEEKVKENAVSEITKDLKKQVKSKLFVRSGYSFGPKDDFDGAMTEWAKSIILDVLKEKEDQIIDKAAKILADKLARSKKGKEIFNTFEKKEGIE